MRSFFASFAFFALLCLGCEGPPGPPGKDALGLTREWVCEGFIPISSSGGVDVFLDVYEFADGGVFASCEVEGGTVQTTSVNFWKPHTAGAASGSCVVTFDLDSPSSGHWTFDTFPNRATATVVYHDEFSSFDNRSWVVLCEEYLPAATGAGGPVLP